jgi:hypothetical protein
MVHVETRLFSHVTYDKVPRNLPYDSAVSCVKSVGCLAGLYPLLPGVMNHLSMWSTMSSTESLLVPTLEPGVIV